MLTGRSEGCEIFYVKEIILKPGGASICCSHCIVSHFEHNFKTLHSFLELSGMNCTNFRKTLPRQSVYDQRPLSFAPAQKPPI